MHCSTKIFLNGYILIDNDGIHSANARQCSSRQLTRGLYQIYLVGFESTGDSELEVTYAGPDTHGIRTVIGSDPIYFQCDPWNPFSTDPVFTLCTYMSDPTSSFDGDCTPTVGIAHSRYPGPCTEAIGTDSQYYNYFAGGYFVPVLGSANETWVNILSSSAQLSIFCLSPSFFHQVFVCTERCLLCRQYFLEFYTNRSFQLARSLEYSGSRNAQLQYSAKRKLGRNVC